MNPNEMQEMLQRAQEMQSKMGELQAELARREYEASAGGGMVTAVVYGGSVEFPEYSSGLIVFRRCQVPSAS